MKFLKIPKKDGEKIRRKLIEQGLFVRGYKVVSKGKYILFPVNVDSWAEYEVVELEAEKLPQKHLKLKDLLSKHLSEAEMDALITSYDVIGDIIIMEIPKSLEKKESIIAKAMLKTHKNVKTITKKLGPMEGKFRVRSVEVIAGEKTTEASYKEHGCKFRLDVSKVYFSVRLSTERKRIAELVKPGERILALFAGVGPFPIVISKTHKDAEIIAIELNPDAVASMEQNIKLNKLKNIKPILGDAREVVLTNYKDFADRVLMPLPKSAEEFLDAAFAGVKHNGIVHLYTMVSINHAFEEAKEKIQKQAKKHKIKTEILNHRIVRPYAPGVVQIVVDFKVLKD